MHTSENIDALAKALSAAQGEMENAPLNKENPHFRSKYADMAAVRDAVMPALRKHKLAIVQGTEIDGDRLTLRTRLLHESGQWIESAYPLPMNTDKPQALGSALTYARRYSLAAICGITADEDDDANTAQQEGASRQARKQTTPFDEQSRSDARAEAYVEGCLSIIRVESDAEALKRWWNEQGADRREHQLVQAEVDRLRDAVVVRLEELTTPQKEAAQ